MAFDDIDPIYGTPPHNAKRVDDLDEALSLIPDNTANLIHAKDVRDIVYTLWRRIEEIDAGVVDISDLMYVNDTPVPATIGGIPQGETFPESENITLQEMFDRLLYPYVAPTIVLNTPPIRAFGITTPQSFSGSVTRRSKNIETITLAGINIPVNLDQEANPVNPIGMSYIIPPIVGYNKDLDLEYRTENITLSVKESEVSNPILVDRQIRFRNRIYWGNINLGNLNLTVNPNAIIPTINNSDILGLTDGSLGNTPDCSLDVSNRKLTINLSNFGNGTGHLIIAYPSNMNIGIPLDPIDPISNPNPNTVSFTVNGLPNSAFRKVTDTFQLTQPNFIPVNYTIYISNTKQNSPLGSFGMKVD